MSPKVRLPGYCRHKAKNLGYSYLSGCVKYFPGQYGSAESRVAYESALSAWLANGRQRPAVGSAPAASPKRTYTVADLAADFLEYALTYYQKNGEVTGEVGCLRSTIRVLVELYGDIPADSFGPKALLDVRDAMIKKGWVRKYINASIWRIKRAFGWAVTQEKIKGETHYRLQAVVSLRLGRSGTKDNPLVKPAPQHLVDAVLPLVGPVAQLCYLKLCILLL